MKHPTTTTTTTTKGSRFVSSKPMATPSAPPPPPPPPPSLQLSSPVSVVGPSYCVDYPVDLTITKKALSLSGGDYAITDINGDILFRVKGKVLSLAGQRSLIDTTGNTILTMRGKLRTMHARWKIFRGESVDKKDLLFSVKKSKLIQFKTKLDVFLAANTSERVCDFMVKGSHHEGSVTVFLGDTNGILAQIRGSRRGKFAVTVYPKVDYAFIAALVVIVVILVKDHIMGISDFSDLVGNIANLVQT